MVNFNVQQMLSYNSVLVVSQNPLGDLGELVKYLRYLCCGFKVNLKQATITVEFPEICNIKFVNEGEAIWNLDSLQFEATILESTTLEGLRDAVKRYDTELHEG